MRTASIARLSAVGALAVVVAAVAALALLNGRGNAAPSSAGERTFGWRTPLGNGEVVSFAEMSESGAPRAIGITFSAGTFTNLPADPSDGHHCFDRDNNGVIAATECIDTHEFVIPLPDAVTRRSDVPFKWVLLNWNKRGHMPPGIYDVPHFDVHYYMEPVANVFAIRDGGCGPEFVNCDDFARAKKPVPAQYLHPDFKDVDAVAPAMGNHLIDVGGHEFHGHDFTRSWIYGIYDGRVTFWEQMISLKYLQSGPSDCSPIKTPAAVATSGYYPTRECVRYDATTNAYSVSLEEFTYREAR
jgi:hypothetical protein